MTTRALLCALLAAVAACTAAPYPRGTAYQGTVPGKDAPSPYWLGSDPDHKPGDKGGP